MAADGAWRVAHGARCTRAIRTAGPGRCAGGCRASLVCIASNCTGHGDGGVQSSGAGRHVRHPNHRPGLQLRARHRPPQARRPQGELPCCTSRAPCSAGMSVHSSQQPLQTRSSTDGEAGAAGQVVVAAHSGSATTCVAVNLEKGAR
jgi:hypothetical protein